MRHSLLWPILLIPGLKLLRQVLIYCLWDIRIAIEVCEEVAIGRVFNHLGAIDELAKASDFAGVGLWDGRLLAQFIFCALYGWHLYKRRPLTCISHVSQSLCRCGAGSPLLMRLWCCHVWLSEGLIRLIQIKAVLLRKWPLVVVHDAGASFCDVRCLSSCLVNLNDVWWLNHLRLAEETSRL